MERLNAAMSRKEISEDVIDERIANLPEKAIQFGGGNFLRGYLDWMIHQLNKQGLFNGSVAIIQPNSVGGTMEKLKEQDALYTVILKGRKDGEIVNQSEIISSVSRILNAKNEWNNILEIAASSELSFIFSNTTEAGITYSEEAYPSLNEVPESFPGKLTVFLYERYQKIQDRKTSGLTIIPCELIEENGTRLKEIVLRKASDWNLSDDFKSWVEQNNQFCDTLVDRIVTGYPKDSIKEYENSLGYSDLALTVGEPYHMLAIDGNNTVKEALPLHQAGINVNWGDITPYRELKVRLLNGPHTMMFSVGYLYGIDTVLGVMEDNHLSEFVQSGFDEILPTVDMPKEEKTKFVEEVKERFLNPFNKHYLTDIGLNAFYKFNSRLIPTLKKYTEQYDELPKTIVFSLAALIAYYRPEKQEEDSFYGQRNEQLYPLNEKEEVLLSLENWWIKVKNEEITLLELINNVLRYELIWGEDLTKIEGLTQLTEDYLKQIQNKGMSSSVKELLAEKGNEVN
ncbi:tagaturonate reductase [Salipaludibacillus sp. CF4.18]|uniref:tagaturonate reductase n=1 Tax=Salipaludibacillus sp. CF4.18 TaxID=3373081 RepID=UPI003EE6CF9C